MAASFVRDWSGGVDIPGDRLINSRACAPFVGGGALGQKLIVVKKLLSVQVSLVLNIELSYVGFEFDSGAVPKGWR